MNPIANHIYGQMLHAEYEAKVRKHQSPKRRSNRAFGVDAKRRVAAFFKLPQIRRSDQEAAALGSKI